MHIININETMNWLAKRNILDSSCRPNKGFLEPLQYKSPVDSGAKTALSKLISSFFNIDGESLLWINEFGIWPSAEDRNLFDGYRRSLVESSPLYEKPGHIFSSDDIDAIGSLLAMILYFCWGAVLVSSDQNLIIKISHDEFIDVFARDKQHFAEIQNRFNDLLQA